MSNTDIVKGSYVNVYVMKTEKQVRGNPVRAEGPIQFASLHAVDCHGHKRVFKQQSFRFERLYK